MSLGPGDRQRLIEIARTSIETHLQSGRLPAFSVNELALHRKAGCFVSLHAGAELRGCIGTFREDQALYLAVAQMAVAAATEDPRFPPVTRRELDDLTLDISVLTPRRRIARLEEIEVGHHGLWVERGPFKGVLLPQVATEERWDRETFLDHTCLKAGLPPGAWRDPRTTIEVFEAEVFGERQRP